MGGDRQAFRLSAILGLLTGLWLGLGLVILVACTLQLGESETGTARLTLGCPPGTDDPPATRPDGQGGT